MPIRVSILCLFLAGFAAPLYAQWQAVVLPHENRTEDPDWDWFSRALSEALIHACYKVPRVHLADETALGDDPAALIGDAERADRLQIHIVLKGWYAHRENRLVVHTEIVQADDGLLRTAVSGSGALENPISAAIPIALGLMDDLKVPLQPEWEAALQTPISTNPDALRTAAEAIDAFLRLSSHAFSTRWQQIEAALTHAARRDTGFALPHFYLGRLCEIRNQPAKAEAAYRAALRADPEHVGARYRLAETLKQQGRTSEALAEFEGAIRQSPINYDIQRAMADIFFNQHAQTVQTRIDRLGETLQTHPDDAEAHYALGAAYDEMNRFEEAEKYLQQAIECDSTLADAHFKLGLIRHRQDRLEDAVRHLRLAVAYGTQFVRVHFHLGEILYQLERYEEAAAAFSQALQTEPTYPLARYQLGLCLRALKKDHKAFDTFQKYAELTEEDGRPYYQMGGILEAQEKWAQAIKAYEKAIEIDPLDAASRYCVAYLYAQRGDLQRAVRQLKAVLRLRPDHPQAEAIHRDIATWNP